MSIIKKADVEQPFNMFPVLFETNNLVGVLPVFKTKESALEWADGDESIIFKVRFKGELE